MNKVLMVGLALMLSACGSYKSVDSVPVEQEPIATQPGTPIAWPTPAPISTPAYVDYMALEIQALVADENSYRLGLGQTELSPGLSCVLYTTTGGDRIQASVAGHNTLTGITQVATFLFQGVFNQVDSLSSTKLNILPVALQPLYQNNILLRCQGQIVILNTGYQKFDLSSDDGSNLYIDGVLTVMNDNAHASQTVSGQRYMRRGVHTFRLDFSQEQGYQELILNMNGSSINPNLYQH